MMSLCIMKRGYNEIFSFPLACPIELLNFRVTGIHSDGEHMHPNLGCAV